MKRSVIVVIVALFCAAGAAIAQQKEEGGMSSWFRSLQRKMETITPKKSIAKSTGVAGIRGAKDDEKAKLYWKGKKGEEVVTEEELMAFQSAVGRALKGENEAAAKELEAFTTAFPDSPLMPDVKRSLEMVKADLKAEQDRAAAKAAAENVVAEKPAERTPETKPQEQAAPEGKQ